MDDIQRYTSASEEAALNDAAERESRIHISTRLEENAKTRSGGLTFPMWLSWRKARYKQGKESISARITVLRT